MQLLALEGPSYSILVAGRSLLPLRKSSGVIYINAQYLAPLAGIDRRELYERTGTDGKPCITVKAGLEIAGHTAE